MAVCFTVASPRDCIIAEDRRRGVANWGRRANVNVGLTRQRIIDGRDMVSVKIINNKVFYSFTMILCFSLCVEAGGDSLRCGYPRYRTPQAGVGMYRYRYIPASSGIGTPQVSSDASTTKYRHKPLWKFRDTPNQISFFSSFNCNNIVIYPIFVFSCIVIPKYFKARLLLALLIRICMLYAGPSRR